MPPLPPLTTTTYHAPLRFSESGKMVLGIFGKIKESTPHLPWPYTTPTVALHSPWPYTYCGPTLAVALHLL